MVLGALTSFQPIGHMPDGKRATFLGPTFHDFKTFSGDPFTLTDVTPATWGGADYLYSWYDPVFMYDFGPHTYDNGVASGWYGALSAFSITGTDRADIISASYSGRVTMINGGHRDDTLILYDHGGTAKGGRGDDVLYGYDSFDTASSICSGPFSFNSDELSVLHGDVGRDRIYYGTGIHRIRGGVGDDDIRFVGKIEDGITVIARIRAGQGDDDIEVGGSFAKAFGGGGDDTFDVQAQEAILTGGEGADTFEFSDYWQSHATLTDFELGTDRIRLGSDLEDLADADHMEQVGDHVVFDALSTTIVFEHTDLAALLASDWLV